jgi:hypothetical protein
LCGAELKDLIGDNEIANGHFEAIAEVLRTRIPEGETIFHSNWSDSQYFIGLAPKHHYFVTLDPVYMYARDPEGYAAYRDVAFGRRADILPVLLKRFKSRYGYVGKNYFGGMIRLIKKDGRFRILKEDPLGILFEIPD